MAIKELQRQELLEQRKLNILWRASALAAVPNNQEYFNEQKTLLNQALSLYLDELIPERQIERNDAVVKSADKLKHFVQNKKIFELKAPTELPQLPTRGKSVTLKHKKKHGR